MDKSFKFKQFVVRQDKTAMKVGTDGVLLGAWVAINSEIEYVLDVGTGTGLIALMLAQRSSARYIHAVELNSSAFEQAVENFNKSNWSSKLSCFNISFNNFVTTFKFKYDLIICNPPFHNLNKLINSNNRAMARFSNYLPFSDLLLGISKLLNKNGSCAFIIPFSEHKNFIAIAELYSLFPKRITHFKGNFQSSMKRTLLQFSFFRSDIEKEILVMEKSRHIYTNKYKNLVKDFYLRI